MEQITLIYLENSDADYRKSSKMKLITKSINFQTNKKNLNLKHFRYFNNFLFHFLFVEFVHLPFVFLSWTPSVFCFIFDFVLKSGSTFDFFEDKVVRFHFKQFVKIQNWFSFHFFIDFLEQNVETLLWKLISKES
jgi:hypothetical protein